MHTMLWRPVSDHRPLFLSAEESLLSGARQETRADRMPLLSADRPDLVAGRAVRVDRVEHIKEAEQSDAAVTVLRDQLLAPRTRRCEGDAVLRKLVRTALASNGNAMGGCFHVAVIAELG